MSHRVTYSCQCLLLLVDTNTYLGMGVQYITTNDGVRLAYETRGKGGPKIVLIHGWSGSRRSFDRNLDLAKHCQVYTFDLRHHGDSERPGWVC